MMKLILALTLLTSTSTLAVDEAPNGTAPAKVKYRAAKDVDFEQLLIQGGIKRPEVSIVTGNVQQGTDGLLRLRENFTDRISMDAGEELK